MRSARPRLAELQRRQVDGDAHRTAVTLPLAASRQAVAITQSSISRHEARGLGGGDEGCPG
jgi:hypothetical protein